MFNRANKTDIIGKTKSKNAKAKQQKPVKKAGVEPQLYLKIGLAVLLFVVTILVGAQRYISAQEQMSVGDVVSEDIVANKRIFYENEEETRLSREELRKNFKPIFDMHTEVKDKAVERVNSVFNALDKIGTSDISSERTYMEFLNSSAVPISRAAFSNLAAFYLYNDYKSKVMKLLDYFYSHGITSKQDLTDRVFKLMNNGVKVMKRSDTEVTEYSVEKGELFFMDELRSSVKSIISQRYALRADKINALNELILRLLDENLFYNDKETDRRLSAALEKVEPVMNIIEKGGVILRKGERVSEQRLELINKLYSGMRMYNIKLFVIDLIFFSIFFVFAILYLDRYFPELFQDYKKYLLIAIEYFFILGFAFVMKYYILPGLLDNEAAENTSIILLVWVPIAAIINTLLLDKKIAGLFSALCSFAAVFIFSASVIELSFLIAASLSVVIITDEISRRNEILFAGLVSGAIMALGVSIIGVINETELRVIAVQVLFALLVGTVQSTLSTGLLSVLEAFLDTATIFRLLELSDLNSPLLREMQMRAPGTYHHSITVSNYVESACGEIGANSLLARVGAYYHDIGKINNPDYYVENKGTMVNKHKNLKPSLSASVIKNHVKNGIELGKVAGLPRAVINFIPEHHGKTTIRYFYNRALQEGGLVDKESYTYPGPVPRSKETAVLMIADSVEAAARSIQKPTADKISDLINDIINDRLKEAQLDRSGLTIGDLAAIKRSLVKSIMIAYHDRMKYPSELEVSGREKESAKLAEEKKNRKEAAEQEK